MHLSEMHFQNKNGLYQCLRVKFLNMNVFMFSSHIAECRQFHIDYYFEWHRLHAKIIKMFKWIESIFFLSFCIFFSQILYERVQMVILILHFTWFAVIFVRKVQWKFLMVKMKHSNVYVYYSFLFRTCKFYISINGAKIMVPLHFVIWRKKHKFSALIRIMKKKLNWKKN